MCSTSDIGTECANPHETRGIPDRILLYDRHPGGIWHSVTGKLSTDGYRFNLET
jgi:hypothetical protein